MSDTDFTEFMDALNDEEEETTKLYKFACLYKGRWVNSISYYENASDILDTHDVEDIRRLDYTMIEI